jgi:surface antigen
MEETMLFRTSPTRFRLLVCAAAVAMASGLAANTASADSQRKPWVKQGGGAVLHGQQQRLRQKPNRGQQPAQARTTLPPRPVQPAVPASSGRDRKRGTGSAYVAPAPQPPRLVNRGNNRGGGQYVRPPAPPVFTGRGGSDRRNRRYAPPPPAPVAGGRPRHGGDDHRRHHGDHKHYKHKHHRHETHVTYNHVQRHYYYRTSARHYYYTYSYPAQHPYPVYYLVPYHVHTAPGYHNHGEQTNYCGNGYTQGGVYTGGAYTAGASHQPGATIIGGILGAAAGSQVGKGKGQLVAVGVGTVIGALIGRDIGRSMDQRDRAYATGSFGHAMETAPSCTTITWNNQQTGNYGSITPVQTYEPEPGRYCREFQQQVVVGGKVQDAYGTACRQPDGSWEIVAEQP